MHTVQAADTSLLFECTMLHSKPGAQTSCRTLVCTILYFTSYTTTPRYKSILLCTRYKPPILACSSNVPCFTANRERRRAAAQLAAQENTTYKDSYLRVFDPARPLHLESWVQRDMQQGFTDELSEAAIRTLPFVRRAVVCRPDTHSSSGRG